MAKVGISTAGGFALESLSVPESVILAKAAAAKAARTPLSIASPGSCDRSCYSSRGMHAYAVGPNSRGRWALALEGSLRNRRNDALCVFLGWKLKRRRSAAVDCAQNVAQ